MLGKPSKRAQKKLEENGTKAQAIVLEIADKGIAVTSGQETIVSNTEVARKVRLKVTPDNEPEFEVSQRLAELGLIEQGQTPNIPADGEEDLS